MAKLKGLTGDWVRFPHLAAELIADPTAFLKKFPMKTEDYACPKEVHDAIDRGRELGDAISTTCEETDAKKLPLPQAVEALRTTVAKHFGDDFIAEAIPFGILFRERSPKTGGVSIAVTGTGSCTFCKDNDSPDVD